MHTNINAYYRLARCDKPAGTWLLLLPCWFGLALAGSADIYLYILFAAGAYIMRAAGCIINDIIDRHIDREVERTRERPIASGEITVPQALIFLAILLAGGLAILSQLPTIAIFISFASVPLFTLYPFMKRVTYWPQTFLGITFNMGVLIAYSTVRHTLDVSTGLLYLGTIFWTLGYDTIYAHQDKDDDMKVGVKSTAIALADNTRVFVIMVYFMFASSVLLAIEVQGIESIISLAILSLAFLQLLWQSYKLKIDNPKVCMMLFKSNVIAGLLVFLALLTASGVAVNI